MCQAVRGRPQAQRASWGLTGSAAGSLVLASRASGAGLKTVSSTTDFVDFSVGESPRTGGVWEGPGRGRRRERDGWGGPAGDSRRRRGKDRGADGWEEPVGGKGGEGEREEKETGGEFPPGIVGGGGERKGRGNPTVGEAPSERKSLPGVTKAGVTLVDPGCGTDAEPGECCAAVALCGCLQAPWWLHGPS